MTDYWLDENPPVRSQYAERPPGVLPRLIVLHTTQQPPDVTGSDSGAEGLARYVQRRSTAGCYHSCVDSDSTVRLVSPTMQCWGARYVNKFALHISHSTKAAMWTQLPHDWVTATLKNSAREVADWCDRYGIPPRLITRTEAIDFGTAGIISHASIDPDRRTDPGVDFPWTQWLEWVSEYMEPITGPAGPTAPEFRPPIDDTEPKVSWCHAPDGGVWLLTDGGGVFAWGAPYFGGLGHDPRYPDGVPGYDPIGEPALIRPNGDRSHDGYTITTDLGYEYSYS